MVVTGPGSIGWAGCSSYQAALAWSFINFFFFLISAILVSLCSQNTKCFVGGPVLTPFAKGSVCHLQV